MIDFYYIYKLLVIKNVRSDNMKHDGKNVFLTWKKIDQFHWVATK